MIVGEYLLAAIILPVMIALLIYCAWRTRPHTKQGIGLALVTLLGLPALAALFFTLANPGNSKTTASTVVFGLLAILCVLAVFPLLYRWSTSPKPPSKLSELQPPPMIVLTKHGDTWR